MTDKAKPQPGADADETLPRTAEDKQHIPQPKGELGGPKGPEPTRYGDWEVGGRCSDF